MFKYCCILSSLTPHSLILLTMLGSVDLSGGVLLDGTEAKHSSSESGADLGSLNSFLCDCNGGDAVNGNFLPMLMIEDGDICIQSPSPFFIYRVKFGCMVITSLLPLYHFILLPL